VKGTATGTTDLNDWPLTLISKAPRETLDLGRILGEVLRPGGVVALSGELGTGKTCFTQGIARGLGVSDKYEITSPTFTLANEYPGRIKLYHLDIYRLAGIGDLRDIGYEEFFDGKGVVVIEWAEKVRDTLPRETLWTFIEHRGENERKIKISGHMDQREQFVGALRKGGF
jgi:tRNA threonylcarbamoyladenosine biosynthesis protein TsaE